MQLPPSIVVTPDEMRHAFADETTRDTLPMLAIYRSPKDYPGAFVVRLWRVVHSDTSPHALPYCMLATSLEEARAMLPRGLACFMRADGDDPCIIETWL